MSEEQDHAVQNFLIKHVTAAVLDNPDEKTKKYLSNQDDQLSSIRWNLTLSPVGVMVILMVQDVLIAKFGSLFLINIAAGVGIFFLLQMLRRSVDKSIHEIRYNEVNQVTLTIAKYIGVVGEANGIRLDSPTKIDDEEEKLNESRT